MKSLHSKSLCYKFSKSLGCFFAPNPYVTSPCSMAATALRQGPVQRSQVLGIDALRVVAEDLNPGALRRVARAHGEPETAREVTDGQQNDEHLLVW